MWQQSVIQNTVTFMLEKSQGGLKAVCGIAAVNKQRHLAQNFCEEIVLLSLLQLSRRHLFCLTSSLSSLWTLSSYSLCCWTRTASLSSKSLPVPAKSLRRSLNVCWCLGFFRRTLILCLHILLRLLLRLDLDPIRLVENGACREDTLTASVEN